MKKYGKNDGKVIGPVKDLKKSDEPKDPDIKEDQTGSADSK